MQRGWVEQLVEQQRLGDQLISQPGRSGRRVAPNVSTAGARAGHRTRQLRADVDLSLIYDLLIGPLFLRSVVRGELLGPDVAEQIVDLVLTAFGTPGKSQRRLASS